MSSHTDATTSSRLEIRSEVAGRDAHELMGVAQFLGLGVVSSASRGEANGLGSNRIFPAPSATPCAALSRHNQFPRKWCHVLRSAAQSRRISPLPLATSEFA